MDLAVCGRSKLPYTKQIKIASIIKYLLHAKHSFIFTTSPIVITILQMKKQSRSWYDNFRSRYYRDKTKWCDQGQESEVNLGKVGPRKICLRK